MGLEPLIVCITRILGRFGGSPMKYLLCIGLIAGFGVIGLCIRSHLFQRVQFYKELMGFIDKFIINVNFIQLNFIDCLDEEINRSSSLSKIFLLYKTKFIDEQLVEDIKISYLHDSEINETFSLLNSIGSTDIENQIAILNGEKMKLEEKLNACSTSFNKYGGMSVKLSVVVGCLLALIFV